jgi:hypothetical protein
MKGDINSSHLLPGPTLSDPCTLLGKMISFVRCLRFNIFYHGRSHARLLISFVIYALSLPWLPQRNPCLCDLALELFLHQLNLNVSSLIPRVSQKFLLLQFFFFFVFLFLARIPPRVIGFCMISSVILGLCIIIRAHISMHRPSHLTVSGRSPNGVLSLRSRDRYRWLRIQRKSRCMYFLSPRLETTAQTNTLGMLVSETT